MASLKHPGHASMDYESKVSSCLAHGPVMSLILYTYIAGVTRAIWLTTPAYKDAISNAI